MKTTYWVWKNPSCAGINPEWQEMTGQAFYAFVNSPLAKERHFIKLPSTHADGSDGAIVMETTKADYLKWKAEKNHVDYLCRDAKLFTTLSYHAMESDDGESYGEEMMADEADTELDYIKSQEPEMLKAALSLLTENERQIIEFVYLTDNPGTERGFSVLKGIPPMTVHDRKTRALKKMKNFFES